MGGCRFRRSGPRTRSSASRTVVLPVLLSPISIPCFGNSNVACFTPLKFSIHIRVARTIFLHTRCCFRQCRRDPVASEAATLRRTVAVGIAADGPPAAADVASPTHLRRYRQWDRGFRPGVVPATLLLQPHLTAPRGHLQGVEV